MKPEHLIQSEVSQKEKHRLYINAYIWNLERQERRYHIQGNNDTYKNRLLDSMGEGEGGMIWESSIEMYTLSYGE